MFSSLTTLPYHLLTKVHKQMDIFADVNMSRTTKDYSDFLGRVDQTRLDQFARLVHLQKKYSKYSSRVAYWSSPDRVTEALCCPGYIELVFRKQQARTARYHEVVTEMKFLVQQLSEEDKRMVKERLELFIEKKQPTKQLGWVSIQQIKNA